MEMDDNLVTNLEDKNIFIFGLGKSGLSVLEKVSPFCNKVIAFDANPDFNFSEGEIKDILDKNANIIINIGDHKIPCGSLLSKVDILIVSPGVPYDHPLLISARRKKIPVISELEFAWQFMNERQKGNTIAVTGTNGKTTLTSLLGFIFNGLGKTALTCGNIGNPLIDTFYFKKAHEDENNSSKIKDDDIIRIIEVSSFQLENIKSFNPHCAIILNITEDHMDRHKSMMNYASIKFKIANFQSENDFLILNLDDKYTNKVIQSSIFSSIKSQKIYFSLSKTNISNLYSKDYFIFYDLYNTNGRIDSSDIKLKGKHNISNILAGLGALKLFDVNDSDIERLIKDFKPLPHRLEFVCELNGVKCFNDSKATNPDATIKALENLPGDITLILGGLDKGMDFNGLIPVLEKKVKNIILIGTCRDKLFNLLNEKKLRFSSIIKADSLEDAVDIGLKITEEGGYFLLSPSCASMDMFKDYKERGDKFKKLLMDRCELLHRELF